MALRGRSVLLDTNAVLESWRTGAWKALAGGHRLETVDMVVTETQTGFQRRRREQQVDLAALKRGLKAVNDVGLAERARLAIEVPDIALDPGERDLWAHAWVRPDRLPARLATAACSSPKPAANGAIRRSTARC